MPQDQFREIKVVYSSSKGDEAWLVELDPNADIVELLPELIETLPIEGSVDDFEVQTHGTIAEPVIVLRSKTRRHVGRYRQAD